ncbi:MAG: alpha-amylase family glycosyl hydrolase [Deinococcales bacterium]
MSLLKEMHLARPLRERYGLEEVLFSYHGDLIIANYQAALNLSARLNQDKAPQDRFSASELFAAGILHEVMHHLIAQFETQKPGFMQRVYQHLCQELDSDSTLKTFVEHFPPVLVYLKELSPEAYLNLKADDSHKHISLEEMLLLKLANENPALSKFHECFDDAPLASSGYQQMMQLWERDFAAERLSLDEGEGENLFEILRAPLRQSPNSLEGQLSFIRERYKVLLGADFDQMISKMLLAVSTLKEEHQPRFFPSGDFVPPLPSRDSLGQGALVALEDYEAFSSDSSWMPKLVLLAKSTYVWLEQLSKTYACPIHQLSDIPDEELDKLAHYGITGLWLIGLWERSHASKEIKHRMGNPDAVASAYSLYDYNIAQDLGGDLAYENLKERALARGIRLASDMVPNHMGIDSRWVTEHPDWFLSLSEPPYPGYQFHSENLSLDNRMSVRIEDHYYDKSDAAVVFERLDNATGEKRYIYHGNDGTSMPWNDTAQLNYLKPEVREGVIQTILHVARQFPIIRFDAAMTLAKKHIQRLWFPPPGEGGAIPSRALYGSMSTEAFNAAIPIEFWREVVDRVAQELPGTLLLAEAFWMMEGYFVRTLGMHRVYNSAFMHMLKAEKNAEYRQMIKDVLDYEPEILKRYVNFMNNPDEETAAVQFGKGDKYFAVATLMATLPGLPMIGHGQFEGFSEKYGMEFRRARYVENPDSWLLDRHERELVPLLRRRKDFAEVHDFAFYDAFRDGAIDNIDEDVYVYSNAFEGRHSLIIIHNAYKDTVVWLKHHYKQGDLNHALALGDADFVIFKDHISQLERLIKVSELAKHGLRVELAPYQRLVFWDLERLYDNDGHYEALYVHLKGRMVKSVQLEWLKRQRSKVHEAFRDILELSLEIPSHSNTKLLSLSTKQQQAWANAYQGFLRALSEQDLITLDAESKPRLSAHFEEGLNKIYSLQQLGEFDKLLKSCPPMFLLSFISLRDLAYDEEKWLLGEVLKDYPLGRFHEDALRLLQIVLAEPEAYLNLETSDFLEEDPQVSEDMRQADLIDIDEMAEQIDEVLAETFAELGNDALESTSPMAQFYHNLVQQALVKDFLRLNHYEGVDYFYQEAFEGLNAALCSAIILEEHDEAELETALKYYQQLEAAKLASEYQLGRLLSALNQG